MNECPKCKETIKGIDKQPEVERLIEFYSKLCIQERAKLEKIKVLVDEREEIQTRINSVLDQQTDIKPSRPTTAQPRIRQSDDENGSFNYKSKKSEVKKEEEVDQNSYYCKICERRPLHMKLKDYKISEMSPFSLNGNEYQQK
jgi:ribosomal protein L37AE/L43A